MNEPDSPFDRLATLIPADLQEILDRDTPIPSIAVAAAQKRLETPELVRADIGQISGVDPEREVYYGPPVGLEPLRHAIAEMYARTFGSGEGESRLTQPFGRTWNHRNVIITTGAAEGISLTLRCFGRDRVVGVPVAHWENYANALSAAGGRAAFVEFFDARGDLDLEGLERAIHQEGIAALLFNFPANPTGAVLDHDEMTALAELARRNDVVLIADEVYARLRYDGQPPRSFLAYAPERTVSISSASKEYLIPGARVGYVACAHANFTDEVLRRLVRANTASPNVLGQRRLLTMVESDLADLRTGKPPAIFTGVREAMRKRRDALLEVLAKHGFEPFGRADRKPEGTIFLMAKLPNWWTGDDTEFARDALEAGCVSTIPGSAFGLPGTVRFSYGGLDEAAIAQLDQNLTVFSRSL